MFVLVNTNKCSGQFFLDEGKLKMNILQCGLTFLIVVTNTSGRRLRRDDAAELVLTPKVFGERFGGVCTTKNQQAGQCVPEIYCTEDHTIAVGGVIEDFELREKGVCKTDNGIWCCTLENISTPPVIESKTNGDNSCTAPESDVCPWCVSLHKSIETKIKKTGLFCMGSMIGSRVILTAGTCIKAAEKQMLWARVPLSADPNRNYTVSFRHTHKFYNTGTHEYDFGILVLENDVDWGKDQWMGACLGLRTPLVGECVGYGFDANGAIVSTLLTARKGACSESGATSDAACGTRVGDSYCLIHTGSPVVCSSGGKPGLVVGVARSSCITEDSALLGSLSMSVDWLTNALKQINVLPKDYEINAS